MRGLDCDQQALFIVPLLAAVGVFVKGKFFEIVVGHVGVLAVTRVIADLLLLLFKHFNQRV